MRLKFTQSSRRHRIAKGRALYVIRNTKPVQTVEDDGTINLDWIGDDDRGLELHIVGIVKIDDRSTTKEKIVLVKHVFPTALNSKEGG